MSAPDISALLESYSPRDSASRAALLDFARNAPLVYGPWKQWKKLFKIVEASALETSVLETSTPAAGPEYDFELLGVLLGRIDTASFPISVQRLKKQEEATTPFRAKSLKVGDIEYSVGGRRTWDFSGWRLRIERRPSTPEAPRKGGLLRALGFGRTPDSEAEAVVAYYDFDARDSQNYIGQIDKLTLNDGVLFVECKSGRNKVVFQVDISDPAWPHLPDEPPRRATFQYMKRRARRILRHFAEQRPQEYFQLLHAMLREIQKLDLDPQLDWAAMDALFGGGTRWAQVGSGRGEYKIVRSHFVLKTREEREPQLWNENLIAVEELFRDESTPVAANLAALKVLRVHNRTLPILKESLLLRFLNGNEPILQNLAAREIAARINSNGASAAATLPPTLFGRALLLSGGRARRELSCALETILPHASVEWRSELASTLAASLNSKLSNKRQAVAVSLLTSRLQEQINNGALFANLELLLDGSANTDWILARFEDEGRKGNLALLDTIAALPEHWRSLVLTAFARAASNSHPKADEVLALVTKDDEAQNRMGWQFLAATAMEQKEARKIWETLSSSWQYGNTVHSAALSAEAVGMWRRANFSANEVRQMLSQYWAWRLCMLTSWEFLQELLGVLPLKLQLQKLLSFFPTLLPETTERGLEYYLPLAPEYSPSANDLRANVGSPTPATWRFLVASSVSREVLREVWKEIFYAHFDANAATLFRRADVGGVEVSEWLQSRKNDSASPTGWQFAAQFSTEFFLAVLEALDGESKIHLILEASEEQWNAAREPFLHLLQSDAAARASFWSGAMDVLETDTALASRLADDKEIAATFFDVPASGFSEMLGRATTAHEALLLKWLDANKAELQQGNEVLIVAATHSLDAIRLWGLRRARLLGLNVAVALRLMESGLPQSFALGREYFESAPRDSREERDYALALCDSPNQEVQKYGREFIARRRSTLLRDELLQNLTEHPDSTMQSWLADQLLQEQRAVKTKAFDTAVLKSRGKARRAKESVKTRLDRDQSTPAVEAAALLELARGSTARDREWALQQLARRAMQGEEISGVSIQSAEKVEA